MLAAASGMFSSQPTAVRSLHTAIIRPAARSVSPSTLASPSHSPAAASQVDTTCGPRPLQQCFLPRSSIDPSTVQLLAQLQLPCLQLPDPDSPKWDFLQGLGVSMELKWPTLLKILQHLSGSGAQPAPRSMKQLYKSVSALEALSQVGVAWAGIVRETRLGRMGVCKGWVFAWSSSGPHC
jgi:hypothetical protein